MSVVRREGRRTTRAQGPARPRGRCTGGTLRSCRSARLELAATVAACVITRPALEVLDGVGHQLGRVALLAVLALPLAGLEAAFDVDLGALAQVLGGELGLLAPGDDAEPLRLFLALALGVLVVAVDRRP